MIEALTLFGIGFVGTVFWLVNPELSSAWYGATLGWHPLLVGIVAASGQCAGYTVLYFGGEILARRWDWLHRQIERTRARFGRHLEEGYLTLMFLGGIIGLPPAVGLAALAGGFGVPWHHVMPVAFAGRVIRFTVIASSGKFFLDWFNAA